MSAAACSAIPLTAWLYVSRVTVTDAWPRRSACSPRSRGAWRCWANTGPISLSSHGVMWRFLAVSASLDGASSDRFEQAWEGSISFHGTCPISLGRRAREAIERPHLHNRLARKRPNVGLGLTLSEKSVNV